MRDGVISIEDPRESDIVELLDQHLAHSNLHSLPEDVHALGVEGLVDPAVTFYCYRVEGELLGVGALKRLDPRHAEIKSMHTAARARRRGIARAMVEHLVSAARERGFERLSLETGAQDAFAPARSLYAAVGFTPCGTFGDYGSSPNSTFMTMRLVGRDR
jgi:putative acetyltransferase